jgi:CubicO group peptidase (beta-lactamase class C family)
VLLLAALAALAYLDRPLRSATGYVSRTLCSGVFVSGLSAEQVYARTLKPMAGLRDLHRIIRYQVDEDRREVRTSLAGAYERRAIATDGLGCLLEPLDGPVSPSKVARKEVARAVLPEIAGPELVEPADEKLRAALDRTFAEPAQPPYRQTAAVVVVRDGRVIAERYAPGYTIETPVLGYSVTKSVFSALAGILVRQGRLSMDAPAPIPRWQGAADPRRPITIDMLVRMTSGLDIPETNREYDAVARMILIERDMAGFAERANLATAPGKAWKYTSGNTLILSRIIRDAVGGGPAGFLEFAQRELFGPLGMRTVTIEFDSAGTPIGSTYLYASARDWARFGMLYLEDGVAGGRRILPEGWVRYSAAQTLDSPYAAGFWRGSRALRARWGWPEDAFFASGLLGQRIMVIPSEQLVVARFGNAHSANYDLEGFVRLVADVREAFRP